MSRLSSAATRPTSPKSMPTAVAQAITMLATSNCTFTVKSNHFRFSSTPPPEANRYEIVAKTCDQSLFSTLFDPVLSRVQPIMILPPDCAGTVLRTNVPKNHVPLVGIAA